MRTTKLSPNLAEEVGFEPTVPSLARSISSRVHSTGLCYSSILFQQLLLSSKHKSCIKERKQERKFKTSKFSVCKKPEFMRGIEVKTPILRTAFRVSPVMTTSIPLRIIFHKLYFNSYFCFCQALNLFFSKKYINQTKIY